MSQGGSQDPGDLTSRPYKRRSSIIQQAKKDGIISSDGDILRGISETFNNLRLSGSGPSRGSSGNLLSTVVGKSSLGTIPQTPPSAVSSVVKPSGTKPSSIPPPRPIPRSVAGKKGFLKPPASSASKVLTGLPPSEARPLGGTEPRGMAAGNLRGGGRGGGGGGIMSRPSFLGRPPPSRPNTARGNGRTSGTDNYLMASLGRSSSLDSNAWASMNMMTPVVTPATGKTPASLKSWGSQNNLNHREKGFRVPGNKDTKQLVAMSQYVYNFLDVRGFRGLPNSPQELKHVSTNTYINMVIDVGQIFVSPKFFEIPAKDDITGKLVELASILQYPSQLSKSHLKSANAQHSWPCCLTFLAWLCARAEADLATEPERPMNDLLNEGFPQIALPNFLKIYAASRAGVNFQQVVDDELNKFRNTVSEQLMGELSMSIDDLKAMKEEKLRELEQITNTPDPCKEVLETLEKTKKLCSETETKIRDAERQIVKYKNLNTLESQGQSLKMQIKNMKSVIRNLKSQVESQPMDRKKANELLVEIDDMRKQRACLAKMNENLQIELEAQKENVVELDDRFRETVAKFTVVETYNTKLCNLGIKGLTVEVNPMTSKKLDVWLKSVSKVQEQSERAAQNWLDAVNRDQIKVRDKIRRAEEDLITVRRRLETTKAATNAGAKLYQEEERRKDAEVKKLKAEVSRISAIEASKENELEKAEAVLSRKEEELGKANEELNTEIEKKKELDNKREENHAGFLLAEAQVSLKCMGYVKKLKDMYYKKMDKRRDFLECLIELKPELFDKNKNLITPIPEAPQQSTSNATQAQAGLPQPLAPCVRTEMLQPQTQAKAQGQGQPQAKVKLDDKTKLQSQVPVKVPLAEANSQVQAETQSEHLLPVDSPPTQTLFNRYRPHSLPASIAKSKKWTEIPQPPPSSTQENPLFPPIPPKK